MHDLMLVRGRKRQDMFGIKSRGSDFGPIEIVVLCIFIEPALGYQSSTRHLPPPAKVPKRFRKGTAPADAAFMLFGKVESSQSVASDNAATPSPSARRITTRPGWPTLASFASTARISANRIFMVEPFS